jgi:DNA invertase Pin-like site-specific DNA recombinase
VRVSTGEQAASGAGLEVQRQAIRAEADRRGWELVEVYSDEGASGKSLKGRPGLSAAFEAIDAGRASGLIVSKLDRLSRSLLDFAGIVDRAQRGGWNLVALDLGVDLATPAGEAMANVMATFAQLERRLISQRTKDALAIKRAEGVDLGRPPQIKLDVEARIAAMHAAGTNAERIAAALNAEHVPTARGGRWHPSTVRVVVRRAERDQGRETPRRRRPADA